jgi:hypothetical protein
MNDAHDPKTGQFAAKGTTGSAVGDHQASQTRPVGPGRQPVLSAKEETIQKGLRIDERKYPTRSNAEAAAMTDLAKPMGSVTATPGRFDASKLDPRRNDHLNAILRQAGSPSANRPTIGQMVAAGLTGSTKG